jgi:hypothetical protein
VEIPGFRAGPCAGCVALEPRVAELETQVLKLMQAGTR